VAHRAIGQGGRPRRASGRIELEPQVNYGISVTRESARTLIVISAKGRALSFPPQNPTTASNGILAVAVSDSSAVLAITVPGHKRNETSPRSTFITTASLPVSPLLYRSYEVHPAVPPHLAQGTTQWPRLAA
jgi:hypothetical protein